MWPLTVIATESSRTLQVAPSTYYAAVNRPPSVRTARDGELKAEITRVYEGNCDAYGARKLWLPLLRENVRVGRDRVARLMKDLGLIGVTRGRRTGHLGTS